MRKERQPLDSGFMPSEQTPQAETQVVETSPAPEEVVEEVLEEVAVQEDLPVEVKSEEKEQPKKASKKQDEDDEDVVQLSTINQSSESIRE
jgi:antitoxin component of RelBE/YafQ-DinJ toxin-antitoxin module